MQATFVECSTPAGKTYNVVTFGSILLCVLPLQRGPDSLGNSAQRQTDVLWIDSFQNGCLAF